MTQHWPANFIMDAIRNIFAVIDLVVYSLLGWMYQILFNAVSWDMFSSEIVRNFYGRMQMILGVFMMFRLAITIVQGIITPETFTDKKSGIGNIISRIVFSMVMLVMISPLNISAGGNEFNEKISNNGLLFGTLYSLQERVLKNNTLGKLVLGTEAASSGATTGAGAQGEEIVDMSNNFSTTILKTFIRINMKEPSDLGISESQLDENNPSHRMCSGSGGEAISVYSKSNATPTQILALVNASCETEGGGFAGIIGQFKRLAGTDRYVFSYHVVLSTIVAVVLIIILIGEIIDIVIRSAKLAVLRLIAPIPIISYIQPSKDNGAFGSWMKSLISTYISLFIHLAIIYFVLFLVQEIISGDVTIIAGKGIIGAITVVFIIIGLFFFIRMAPKFITNALGIKSTGGGVGLNAIMGGAAAVLGGGGASGFALGALSGAETSVTAYNQGKAYGIGDAWNQNSDLMAKIRTGDKDAKGGALGALMDRANYATREKSADSLGIGSKDMADAKYIADVRKAQADTTKRELDLAAAEYNNLSPDATAEERAQARAKYEAAYAKNDAYQAVAAKAQSNYEKMDKDRANIGVGPRVSDKRRHQNTYSYKVNYRDAESRGKDGSKYDDARGEHVLREGTYRSPLTTDVDSKESTIGNMKYSDLPDNPKSISDKDILGEIGGHKRDLNNFSGTTDDSSIASSGHGSGGGPGRGPGPGPRP